MDQMDLVVELARATRAAKNNGDDERFNLLHATLSQEVHTVGLGIAPSQQVPAAVIHHNGALDLQSLKELGVEVG